MAEAGAGFVQEGLTLSTRIPVFLHADGFAIGENEARYIDGIGSRMFAHMRRPMNGAAIIGSEMSDLFYGLVKIALCGGLHDIALPQVKPGCDVATGLLWLDPGF